MTDWAQFVADFATVAAVVAACIGIGVILNMWMLK